MFKGPLADKHSSRWLDHACSANLPHIFMSAIKGGNKHFHPLEGFTIGIQMCSCPLHGDGEISSLQKKDENCSCFQFISREVAENTAFLARPTGSFCAY